MTATDAEFLGLELYDDGLAGSAVVTHRLMSPRGAFYGGAGLAFACTMMERATERSTVWCTVQFVNGAALGDRLELHTEVVAHGHRTSQARVVARHEGREVFSAIGATGAAGTRVSETFATMPTVSKVEQSAAIAWDFGVDPAMTHFATTELREAVIKGATEGSTAPSMALWLRMHERRSWSPTMLAFVADIVPMSIHRVLGHREPGGKSLDNSLRVGPPRETDWILLALYPETVHDGYGHGSVQLWAPDGTLLGVASQSFALRSAPPG
jgi:acyl-CoA thioesterase